MCRCLQHPWSLRLGLSPILPRIFRPQGNKACLGHGTYTHSNTDERFQFYRSIVSDTSSGMFSREYYNYELKTLTFRPPYHPHILYQMETRILLCLPSYNAKQIQTTMQLQCMPTYLNAHLVCVMAGSGKQSYLPFCKGPVYWLPVGCSSTTPTSPAVTVLAIFRL